MVGVDTNILAKFFVSDPEDSEANKQRPIAIQIMSQKVFVSASVVLEFEWVLRGFYELPRKEIRRVFEALCGLENVYLENRSLILAALNYYQLGLDFADSIHLASSVSCDSFKSFDQKLARKATALQLSPAVGLS